MGHVLTGRESLDIVVARGNSDLGEDMSLGKGYDERVGRESYLVLDAWMDAVLIHRPRLCAKRRW